MKRVKVAPIKFNAPDRRKTTHITISFSKRDRDGVLIKIYPGKIRGRKA